uniref:Ig-like domain-containing protein n=1 Tax=Panagrolaimus sp. JU765 TaxID=591449 RepID=A0AC34R3B7_9BILA
MKQFLPKLLLFWLISEVLAKPTKQSGLIKRRTADDLGTPECDGDRHCTLGGTCRDDGTGKKRCMCSASCYLTVPLKCAVDVSHSCVTMGENYVSKYNVSVPYCYHGRCVCPPQYDPLPVKQHTPGFTHMPPMKCDKRELKIMVAISPADSVYKGTEATIYCCVNQDPRDFVADESVMMVQNGTRNRVLNTTPYEMFSADEDALFAVPTCWSLTISNVQSSDSGTYTCVVQPKSALYSTQNQTVHFTVKTPRMIQDLTIIPNATQATISWNTQEGPMLKIGIKVFKRVGGKRKIFAEENVKSPVILTQLEPATPYTVFITVQDGQMDPFELTEQFQSLDGQSQPPQTEDIRLTNTVFGLQCEVEWREPHISNGQILKYYVQ